MQIRRRMATQAARSGQSRGSERFMGLGSWREMGVGSDTGEMELRG